jgi:histidinol dehydrogenase
VCPDEDILMEMANDYAPEHLVLSTQNHARLAEKVKNAGSVFLGHFSPESAGDYASGTNHTLPTAGFARAYSGLTLDSFMKSVTFQELTAEGLKSIAPAIAMMARAEGLEAHARAAEIRMDASTLPLPGEPVDENAGSGYPHFFEYLNPVNILNPLNLFDPENEHSPLSLLNRLSTKEQPVIPYKPRIEDLLRPNIAGMIPYSSARDEFSGHEGIFLDANENPNDNGMNRYPDPRQSILRNEIAQLKGVKPEEVFLGNGSDEAIDLLIRMFCEPRQSRIITLSPTYGMYSVCAGVQDAEVDRVLLNPDFTLNLPAILDTVRFDTRLIFLCSPNNPTGNQIPLEQIGFLARNIPGILVVEEAYIDFAEGPSALELIGECPNIVVLQTFSKAWGLAGVRLGMAFASSAIISVMNKVKYPYNVNILTASAVGEVIRAFREKTLEPEFRKGKADKKEGRQFKRPDVRILLWERTRLERELLDIDVVEKVFPSDANFLLVRFQNPKVIYNYLAQNGIVVRDRSTQPLCEGCLRITIGTAAENDQLLKMLRNYKPDNQQG